MTRQSKSRGDISPIPHKTKKSKPGKQEVPWMNGLEQRLQHPAIGSIVASFYVLLIMILGLRMHLMADGVAETDFLGAYVNQARSFLNGHVAIDAFRGPVYPIVLALVYLPLQYVVGTGFFEAGIILSALSAGAILFLTHRLCMRLFDPRLAFIILILLLLNPVFVRYSYTASNDMLFTALATSAVFVFLMVAPQRKLGLVWAGILAALAYLTRYNGVAIIIAMIGGVLVLNLMRQSWGRRITSGCILLLLFMGVVLPWGLYCLQEQGAFFVNKNYMNVAYGLYAEGKQFDRFFAQHPGQFDSLIDVVTYDPIRFVREVGINVLAHLRHFGIGLLGWPLSVFALLGLVQAFFVRPNRDQVAYFLFGLVFFGLLTLVFYDERFFLFLIPAGLILGGCGLVYSSSWFQRIRIIKTSVIAFIFVGLIGYSGYQSYNYNKTYIPGGPIGFREAGEWFDSNIPDDIRGRRVVARKPHFAYFAKLEHVGLPLFESERAFIVYLREQDADYLFFSYVAARTRPRMASLSDPHNAPQLLHPLMNNSVGVLYEIDKEILATYPVETTDG